MTNTDYRKGATGKPLTLEAQVAEEDRLFSPSSARNRDALRDTFLAHMPRTGLLIEIGAGTGEHCVHIAPHCPDLLWQPSDPDPISRASIDAWRAHGRGSTIAPALNLDVSQPDWPQHPALAKRPSGVMSVNMIHIAPFEAAKGLIAGAGACLCPAGKLFLYGPFSRKGKIAPSNVAFDQSLKRRDERWGVRDLDREIIPLAVTAGLHLSQIIEMPANNLVVIFEKR